jgi:hypothetical protein
MRDEIYCSATSAFPGQLRGIARRGVDAKIGWASVSQVLDDARRFPNKPRMNDSPEGEAANQ